MRLSFIAQQQQREEGVKDILARIDQIANHKIPRTFQYLFLYQAIGRPNVNQAAGMRTSPDL